METQSARLPFFSLDFNLHPPPPMQLHTCPHVHNSLQPNHVGCMREVFPKKYMGILIAFAIKRRTPPPQLLYAYKARTMCKTRFYSLGIFETTLMARETPSPASMANAIKKF